MVSASRVELRVRPVHALCNRRGGISEEPRDVGQGGMCCAASEVVDGGEGDGVLERVEWAGEDCGDERVDHRDLMQHEPLEVVGRGRGGSGVERVQSRAAAGGKSDDRQVERSGERGVLALRVADRDEPAARAIPYPSHPVQQRLDEC